MVCPELGAGAGAVAVVAGSAAAEDCACAPACVWASGVDCEGDLTWPLCWESWRSSFFGSGMMTGGGMGRASNFVAGGADAAAGRGAAEGG